MIDREVVLSIARLAHIDLSEEEVELFGRQLQNILQYVEKLNEVNQPADPFSFSNLLPSYLRSDEHVPGLSIEETLRNAPERVKQFFKVPRIIP